jgi:hypothetical protein
MNDQNEKIGRRTFLKIGSAGLAAMATGSLRHSWAQGAPLPTRNKPEKPVVLKSSELEVTLDPKDGLPFAYRLLRDNAQFRGEDFGSPIAVAICERGPWKFSTAPVTVSTVKAGRDHADFRFEATSENRPAATFTVRYRLSGATLVVTLEDVQEHDGFELIEVALPRLATVREEDGKAWLAHGETGGNLVLLNEAHAGTLPPNRFWGNVLASLPVVMIGTDKAICVQEVTAFMDGTALEVAGTEGHRRASLGTTQTYRVNASGCYDLNLDPGQDSLNCGKRQTPNLLVGQQSSCRLDFIADVDGNGTVNWLDGAKSVRERMPRIPNHYYDERIAYGIHCDEPHFEKPGATFEQSEELIRKVAALIDNSPQVVHLWGWQYRGKDTGYPAVAEVNQRVGGYDALMHLMEQGPKYNCNVTFSDNYDDAYKSSPAWDTNIIARRPDGELWESRNWTGENSYIVGLAKYMQGPGLERVRYTCERYKLKESTHIDVLSYYSIRNDWDPSHPASGIKNLFDGRYKVLDEFAKHKVDVSSEALRYAFIGKISCFWYPPSPAPCPFGGKPIPMLATIYRQSAVWGFNIGRRGATSAAERAINFLFYNAAPHTFITVDSDLKNFIESYYLMWVPWFKLNHRNVESFRRDGDRTVIGLEGNSHVDLDWANKTYSVTLDGAEIARDGSTFCPLDGERIALYSSDAKELSASLPRGWEPKNIAAIALSVEKPQPLELKVESGKVTAAVPAQQPVIIYREGDKAKKRLLAAG